MKKIISKIIIILLASFIGIGPLLYSNASYADTDVCSMSVAPEVYEAAGCGGGKDKLPGTVVNIINAIIAVSSIVAIVFVIVGGISYMTSNGDPGKIEKAKKTILYSVIGLVICALTFAIVNWTIDTISKSV